MPPKDTKCLASPAGKREVRKHLFEAFNRSLWGAEAAAAIHLGGQSGGVQAALGLADLYQSGDENLHTLHCSLAKQLVLLADSLKHARDNLGLPVLHRRPTRTACRC